MTFLRPNEIRIMQHDYETLLRSPESCSLTIEYKTWLIPTAVPDIDPVYKVDRRATDPQLAKCCGVRAIQKIIDPVRDTKLIAAEIVEVGDCIFYVTSTFNPAEPITGKPVVPNSLTITDPSGTIWVPKPPRPGPARQMLVLRVGSIQIGQPILCGLKK